MNGRRGKYAIETPLSVTCAGNACLCILFLCAASRGPAQGNIPTWSVAASATVSVGGDGTPATEFSSIEGATRLSNGNLAVADGSTHQIRLFDAQGRHVTSFGRSGSGPGEFRALGWLGCAGDTAFVFDSRTRRITSVLLLPEPRLLSTLPVRATGNRGAFYVSARLSDGRWLVQTFTSPSFEGPPGVHRLPGSVGIIGPRADLEVDWLGEYMNLTIFVNNPTGNVKDAAVGPIAFSPELHAATSGGAVWVGDSDTDSLIRFSARGERSSVKLPLTRLRPTQAAIDALRAAEFAAARRETGRSFVTARYSARNLPRQLPFYRRLLPGPGGEVWVEEYAQDRAGPARYLVLDPSGKPRARVSLPAGVRAVDVGADFVVGVHKDADGVESVRLYRLTRT